MQREHLHFSVILRPLSIGPAPGIEPATFRSAVKPRRSTDWADPAAVKFSSQCMDNECLCQHLILMSKVSCLVSKTYIILDSFVLCLVGSSLFIFYCLKNLKGKIKWSTAMLDFSTWLWVKKWIPGPMSSDTYKITMNRFRPPWIGSTDDPIWQKEQSVHDWSLEDYLEIKRVHEGVEVVEHCQTLWCPAFCSLKLSREKELSFQPVSYTT